MIERMIKDISSGGNLQNRPLAVLMEQFRQAASATTADRTAKDQLLDELQEAVGLSGQMTTERDILRRAKTMLQGS